VIKRKILFIVTVPGLGGAQKWVADQIKLFSEEFDLYFSCAEDGWLVNEVKSHVQAMLIDQNLNKKFSFSYLRNLNQFINKNKIDLIVASSANAGVHARIGRMFTKKEVIYVSHGWSAVYNGNKVTRPIYVLVESLLSKLTDKILNVSASDQKIAEEIIGIKHNKIVLIENAIYPLGKRLEIADEDKLIIVMVARFESPKRPDLLIQSVQNLENVELYLVGDGSMIEQCQKYKADNIHFVGASDNVYEVLQKCNVFALISDHEGLPMSALEAMSIGMPLLLSNINGCQPLVHSNGFLVDNTITAIQEGIKCLQNADLEQLSRASCARYNEKFNLNDHKKEYKTLYEGS